MISLGIDPGTRRIGYGIVRSGLTNQTNPGAVEFVAAGILKIDSSDDPSALVETKRELDALIKKYKPDAVAIEKLFFAKNQKTALAVAQARGVILLAVHERNVPIWECTPNEVKSGIAGYGHADKKAVLKMVQFILGKRDLKVIDDASDALALAILAGTRRY
jgi:crossover junction endodeoxyribonuclease RuvC